MNTFNIVPFANSASLVFVTVSIIHVQPIYNIIYILLFIMKIIIMHDFYHNNIILHAASIIPPPYIE